MASGRCPFQELEAPEVAFSKRENNDGHLGGGPHFYPKIIALVRVQDIGTFEEGHSEML